MKRILFQIALILLLVNAASGQVIFIPIIGFGSLSPVQEHGFLPGKKFSYYPTIDKYDFSRLNLRVELFDDRPVLNLMKVQCSEIEFTNTSEFADPGSIFMIRHYLDTLFYQAGARLDSTASDTIQVRLEGLDARMIGFGSIRAHGLCQMKIKYHDITKTYCIDITDKDKHSPVGKNAFLTRKTATRIIASASVREVIEQFFIDLKSYQ